MIPTRDRSPCPGTYTVRLSVDGRSLTAPLTIQPDPRVRVTDAELQAQLTFALKVRDDLSKVVALVAQVRSIRTQITQEQQAWQGKLPGDMADACDADPGPLQRSREPPAQSEGRGDL